MFDFKLSKNNIILIVILVIGLLLRFLYLDKITFFYDQARDVFESFNIIIQHHPKILGPATDIPGLFHGPLYWYILSPIYFLTHGNVVIVRTFFILLSLFNIVLMYFLAKRLFRNNIIALVSCFLFAVSFEVIQYSRWLSNPAPAVLTIGLLFYGLWNFIEGESWGLPLTLFGLGLSMQFQLFLAYEAIYILAAFIFVLLTKKKKRKIIILDKLNILLYGLSALSVSTFGIAELKFRFQGLKALLSFLTEKKNNSNGILAKLSEYINSLVSNVRFNFVDNQMIAKLMLLVLGMLIVYYLLQKTKEKKQLVFLSVWFLSPVMVYFIGGTRAYFLNIGNAYPLILLFVFLMYKFLWEKKDRLKKGIFLLLITVIGISNLQLIIHNDKKGDTLFAIQQEMLLPYQEQVIDWIYKESDKKEFAINSVTNPLFINSTWAFQFNYYGKPKYGNLPLWLGYPQQDYPGGTVPFQTEGERKGKKLFLIIEPPTGIPLSYIEAYRKFEDLRSVLIKSKKISNFMIEERLLTSNKAFSRDKVFEFAINNQSRHE